MLDLMTADNSEDLSLTGKSVNLQAQCDKEKAGSSLTDELMMINTFRKRQRNRVMNIPA